MSTWQSRAGVVPGAGFTGPAWSVLGGILLLALYLAGLYRGGPLLAGGVVLFACIFVGTLMVLELGIAVVILAMLLSPELDVGQLSLRSLTIRLEDILIPILALALMARKTLGLDRRELRHDPILTWIACYLTVQLFSTYLGWGAGRVDIAASGFYILKQFEYFALFYFVAQYVHTERRARNLIILAVITALLTASYNMSQIPSTEVWTANRISAPFEGDKPEPSSIGAYYVLMMGLVLAFILEAPSRRIRNRLLFAFAFMFVPFLFTLSRGSYVAFLVMTVVAAMLSRNRALVAILVVGLLLSPLLLPDAVIERVMYTFNDRIKTFGIFDRSLGERIYIWYKVYWNMREAPWLGKGVTYHQIIDSFYARTLVETGLIGLFLFIGTITRLLMIAGRVRRQHPTWWARGFALGMGAAIVGLLVHSLSAITFVIIRIMEPFWAASGILLGLYYQLQEKADENADNAATELNGSSDTWTASSPHSAS